MESNPPEDRQPPRSAHCDSVVMEVPAEQAGNRLDKYVAHICPSLSRAYIQKLIEAGAITVDGKTAKPSMKVTVGAVVSVSIPPPRPATLEAESIPITIVYEDEDLIVIDKPAGLVVHPAPGHPGGTLVNALLARYPNLRITDTLRPGIVHRLDKDTSGLMVVARNDRAFASLVDQMKRRQVLKEYLTLVHGRLQVREGTIDAPIGRNPRERKMMAIVPEGKPARTRFRVIEELDDYSLVSAWLETGRTHQIRVHLASIGHPVVGDRVYGPRKEDLPISRQFLHAHRLSFRLPGTGREAEFESPLPADLLRVLDYLRSLDSIHNATERVANTGAKKRESAQRSQRDQG